MARYARSALRLAAARQCQWTGPSYVTVLSKWRISHTSFVSVVFLSVRLSVRREHTKDCRKWILRQWYADRGPANEGAASARVKQADDVAVGGGGVGVFQCCSQHVDRPTGGSQSHGATHSGPFANERAVTGIRRRRRCRMHCRDVAVVGFRSSVRRLQRLQLRQQQQQQHQLVQAETRE